MKTLLIPAAAFTLCCSIFTVANAASDCAEAQTNVLAAYQPEPNQRGNRGTQASEKYQSSTDYRERMHRARYQRAPRSRGYRGDANQPTAALSLSQAKIERLASDYQPQPSQRGDRLRELDSSLGYVCAVSATEVAANTPRTR